MTGRTIQARCQHNLGRRVEPSPPAVEPVEPMTGVQFVTVHPALARALARLAVAAGRDEDAPAPPTRSDRASRR
jgi:hypothetical protein